MIEAAPARDPQKVIRMMDPFPDNQISKLPKETKDQNNERKTNRNAGMFCSVCKGWHHKNAIHLDYVGHAAITKRLLDVDPLWSWEPMSTDGGLPAFDSKGGLWIRLTVCGITRIGYGDAPGKSGGDAVKEAIGDAIRNAAMRFGAALDLWHKGDLYGDDQTGDADKAPEGAGAQAEKPANTYPEDEFNAHFPKWKHLITGGTKTAADIIATVETRAQLTKQQKDKINGISKAGESA